MTKSANKLVIFSDIDVEKALKNAVKKPRPDIISELRESALKGRGGAGFPTSVKWNLAASAQGERKFVICNADEGEPGTFKDRVLLTDYAEQLIAGMILSGYVVGAKEGIIYLRAEYTYLKHDLEATIEKMRGKKLLGKNAAGKEGFEFDVHIHMGSGAYICGEETALIESLEGHRGEPRNRPPFPVTVGYLGCPTSVNNVETFITALHVVEKGAKWFKTFGTEKSTGTKLFSVSGDCEKPGVYELPMGITIQKLLETVDGTGAKAVQVGGASGICVPAKDFEKALAFEGVATGGSIIVFGQHRDMLEVAINFMEFFCEESCGQCTPCRLGTETLLEGLDLLSEGKCSLKYLRELTSLGETMQVSSKCGLGQSAPNAFLSIIENFKSEIFDTRCSCR
ncbi:MAG: SLBB domain-containing protein [Candidatus Riflebacteria bacterium]|nr:SLBB domain-containing protein [Candidatus Riflebacteria bacterium]